MSFPALYGGIFRDRGTLFFAKPLSPRNPSFLASLSTTELVEVRKLRTGPVQLDLSKCADSIAEMTPRQALRVADALTRAALKAEGKP